MKPSIRSTTTALMLLLAAPAAQGVILFGLDNAANRTDPGTGAPFASVGVLTSTDSGVTSPNGSAIYLGDGYMLTANHVGMNPYVTFDGSTFYQRDLSFSPVQVAANLDLKIFRLTTTPTVAAVTLCDDTVFEQIAPATQVGWGVGRDPAVLVDSTSVSWGDTTTVAKRWGGNVPMGTVNIPYQIGTYEGLFTVLGSSTGSPPGLGDNESASALLDSGSALFQELGGIWYLIGVATAVEVNGSSVFGNDQIPDPSGHWNYFARVSTYHDEIVALIPEPATTTEAASLALLALLRRRRTGGRNARATCSGHPARNPKRLRCP